MAEFVRRPLEGLLPLLPLTLTDDQEIDHAGIRHNIELLVGAGIQGFVALGSMGGMSSISDSEFDEVCETVVAGAEEHDLAAVVGSTATFQREAVRRARYAEKVGADGSMLAAPYALPLTPGMATRFFQEVAESLDGEMALMLYNYSPLNGLNIAPEMWEHLLAIPNIKAIKESNTALPHLDEVLLTIADKVNVFSGNDPAFFHASMLGATGATGIFAWCGLRVTLRFIEACREHRHGDPWVLRAFAALQHLSAAIRRPTMPSMLSNEHAYLNALVELGGGRAGPPRKPYQSLPDAAVSELTEAAMPLLRMESELQ